MQFGSLRVANFGSIGEIELPLSDQGLALILGRNEDAPRADSNGAGKSLPLDAFTWALWGNTVRGFGSDEVVNKKENKNCSVTVSFTDGGKEYEVTRYRKNKADKDRKANDLILRCQGKDVSGASIAATQEAVEEILGLDFTTFCAMMPGAGVNVATMTDAQVKLILESILRTETLSKASDVARRRYRECFKQVEIELTRLTDLQETIKEDKERIEDLAVKEAGYADSRQEKIREVKAALDVLETNKDKWDAIVATEPALTLQKGELLQSIGGAAEVEKLLKQDYAKVDLHYTDKVRKLNEDKIVVATKLEAVVSSKRQNVGVGTCDQCGQSITAETLEALREKLRSQERGLMIKVDTIEKSTNLTRESWQKEKNELDKLLGPATTQVANLHAELAKVELALGKVREAKTESSHTQQRVSVLSQRMIELEAEANPFTGLLEKERAKTKARQEAYDRMVLEYTALVKQAEILDFWVKSFSPSGIRSFMLEHVTPLLNQFAKKYADLITDGEMSITFNTRDTLKSGKSKERFNIEVSQKHGGGSYASNSSGERARANLVIAMALGELASLRAEKTIPFRFLDEPFESIDESGTEAIVTLLNQQQEKYNTVYVITHQDHFKQLFPKKLTMVKQNGISSLEK